MGGSEQPTKYIWLYIFPPSLSFTVGHFIFLFFPFCSFVVVFVVVFFFFLAPPTPSPISPVKHAGIGHAMVNKLHYLVDITLIVLPFGLPWVFLAVRFSLFCFLSPFGFGYFALLIVFGVLDSLQILLLSLLVFLFPLFFLFWSPLKSKRQMEIEEFGLSQPYNPDS